MVISHWNLLRTRNVSDSSCRDKIGKYAAARWATDDNIIQRAEDGICMPDN